VLRQQTYCIKANNYYLGFLVFAEEVIRLKLVLYQEQSLHLPQTEEER
jgi:hypothetical protein